MKIKTNDGMIPFVHYHRQKKEGRKTYYFAEINTMSGTHGIWLDKSKIDEIKTRN